MAEGTRVPKRPARMFYRTGQGSALGRMTILGDKAYPVEIMEFGTVFGSQITQAIGEELYCQEGVKTERKK